MEACIYIDGQQIPRAPIPRAHRRWAHLLVGLLAREAEVGGARFTVGAQQRGELRAGGVVRPRQADAARSWHTAVRVRRIMGLIIVQN
jgi:hypothetical protein